MNHDEYWRKVKHEAEERVHALFAGCRTRVRDIVGDGNGIDERTDAEKVLAYVMEHGEPDEAARAILALGEWTHAHHELREHGDVAAAGAAAQ